MRNKGIVVLLAAFGPLMGCMHGGAQSEAKSSTVFDADVGRLGPEQGGLVNQARREVAEAKDALSRAKLKLQEAQNEQGTAKADQAGAEADQKTADAQQKVADDSRTPEALEKAQRLQAQAKAHKEVAESHLEYANKLTDERKEEVQAAEQKVKVAEARVEWSKLRALQAAKNPAASKYDAGRFQTAVNDAQGDLDKATQKAQELEAQATTARRQWVDAKNRSGSNGSNPASAPDETKTDLGTGRGAEPETGK
jgi:chromosome segregation ATPase